MFCLHPLVWQIVFMILPDIRQAAGATVSAWDFVLRQDSGNAALLIWSSNPKTFTSVVTGEALSLFGGQMQISKVTLVAIAACVVIMVALMLFTGKSKVGTAMRAVSEDKGAAQLMGINVNTTISITFAIGSGLAAIAGVLLCSAYPTLMPTTGSLPGIKAFTAAVFGGIGSIPGAFIGGILLGTGGLVRAYTDATKAAIEAADIVTVSVCVDIVLEVPYGLYEQLCRVAEGCGAKLAESDFAENVLLTFRMLDGTQASFLEKLTELTRGQSEIIVTEPFDAAF